MYEITIDTLLKLHFHTYLQVISHAHSWFCTSCGFELEPWIKSVAVSNDCEL